MFMVICLWALTSTLSLDIFSFPFLVSPYEFGAGHQGSGCLKVKQGVFMHDHHPDYEIPSDTVEHNTTSNSHPSSFFFNLPVPSVRTQGVNDLVTKES